MINSPLKAAILSVLLASTGSAAAACPTPPPLPTVEIEGRHQDLICRAVEVDWSAVALTIAQLKKNNPKYQGLSTRDFVIQTYCYDEELDEDISLIQYTATHSNNLKTTKAAAAALGPDLLRVAYGQSATLVDWAMYWFRVNMDDRYLGFANVIESELKRHGVQPDQIKACVIP